MFTDSVICNGILWFFLLPICRATSLSLSFSHSYLLRLCVQVYFIFRQSQTKTNILCCLPFSPVHTTNILSVDRISFVIARYNFFFSFCSKPFMQSIELCSEPDQFITYKKLKALFGFFFDLVFEHKLKIYGTSNTKYQ